MMSSDPVQIVRQQQLLFKAGKTRNISFRKRQLRTLRELLEQHEEEIYEALRADMQKPPLETYGTEIGLILMEIDHILSNIESWARARKVGGALINFPSSNYIYPEPYGVALVIGAWNYPVHLSIYPALASIAAGNCNIIKPSERAPHSSSLVSSIINNHFDPGFLFAVEGDAETVQQLLKQPLDYIFFTGSNRVGRIIMEAAAAQLTPVTLELGGKSPAIVDDTANLEMAAKRIIWGKCMNAGQTCVAPDYLYVQSTVKKPLLKYMKRYIEEFYGPDLRQSEDYPRIINRQAFDRLTGLLESGRIVVGGDTDEADLYMEPTVLDEVTWKDPVMQEEIFGPILPVLEFTDLQEVVESVSSKPKPLALYLFSSDRDNQQKIISEVPFGGGCINDTLGHLGNPRLPFGGIGHSGMGNYHGKTGFETFSHKKSIMKKPNWPDIPLRYPPYEGKLKWIKRLIS
ncbi:MAG: aldehyde dehydrogenase [Balneolaceae bacterium]|nr:aldehyde dehydrogenase [Balneolaceae bacterium]